MTRYAFSSWLSATLLLFSSYRLGRTHDMYVELHVPAYGVPVKLLIHSSPRQSMGCSCRPLCRAQDVALPLWLVTVAALASATTCHWSCTALAVLGGPLLAM